MRKRLLAMAMAMVLALSLLSVGAVAADIPQLGAPTEVTWGKDYLASNIGNGVSQNPNGDVNFYSVGKIVDLTPKNGAENYSFQLGEGGKKPTISIEFDRAIKDAGANSATVDYSKEPLRIYHRYQHDDYWIESLFYEANNGASIINGNTAQFTVSPYEEIQPNSTYRVTMGEGFIQFEDGSVSPEIKKGDWVFPKKISSPIAFSFLNEADDQPYAGFRSVDGYKKISGDYYNILQEGIGWFLLNPVERALVSLNRNDKWIGHCFGMAAVFSLEHIDKFRPSFYQMYAHNLRDLKRPKDGDTIYNVLTFYHLLQGTRQDRFKYNILQMADGKANNIKEVIAIMKKQPKQYPAIIEMTCTIGQHAIAGWDLTETKDGYQIKIWDPNSFEPDVLYVSSDYKQIYLKSGRYEISKVLSAFPAQDLPILEDLFEEKYGDIIWAPRGSLVEQEQEENTAVVSITTSYDNFVISKGDEKAVIQNGMRISGNLPISDGINIAKNVGIDSEDKPQWKFFIPTLKEEEAYTISDATSLQSEELLGYDTEIVYDASSSQGYLSTMHAEKPGMIKFDGTGSLEASFGEKTRHKAVVVRNSTKMPWIITSISAESSKMSLIPEDEQVVVVTQESSPVHVKVNDSFSTTDIGKVTPGASGITITSNDTIAQVINNDTKATVVEKKLLHSIRFYSLGGTLLDSIVDIENGVIVNAPAMPSKENYTFDGWYTSEKYLPEEEWTFDKPVTEDITLYAKWEKSNSGGTGSISSPKREISVHQTENGEVKASPTRAAKGRTVTLTVTPDEGYQLDKLTVTDRKGNALELTDKGEGKFTFQMPASKVEVAAVFAKIPERHPFVDVAEGAWYDAAVQYVYEKGMMNGVTATTFGPELTTTRGMIVTMLYRLEGSPAVTGDGVFTDVEAGAWYAAGVNWAAANGVVNGVSPTEFAPNAPITREQMAAILYRYANHKGYDVSQKADLGQYADAEKVSAYAADAMAWANGAGIVGGVTADTLDPQGSATRAQVAAMMQRFCAAQ